MDTNQQNGLKNYLTTIFQEYLSRQQSKGTKHTIRQRLAPILDWTETFESLDSLSDMHFYEYLRDLNVHPLQKSAIWRDLFNMGLVTTTQSPYPFYQYPAIWEQPDDPNGKYINEFLLLHRNDGTNRHHRQKLNADLRFLYNLFGRRFILEYTKTEIRALFMEIDRRPITKNAKHRYRASLKGLITFILDELEDQEMEVKHPNYSKLFNDKYFSFTETSQNYREFHYFTADEIIDFLQRVKHFNTNDYILFKLLLSSVRGVGAINILVKNVDLERCFFDTKDKQTKNRGWNRYFFSQSFAAELRVYMLRQGFLDPKTLKVRQARENDRLLGMKHPKSIRDRLKKYDVPFRPHDFRRSMERLWKNAGMNEVDRNTLTNHAQSIDGRYSGINPFKEPKAAQELYQKFFDKIFRGRL